MKPLLLVPAPDATLLQTALTYGADGGYAPVKGLCDVRFQPPYFDRDTLPWTLAAARKQGKLVYPVINGKPTEEQLAEFNALIDFCVESGAPGIVLGDWGLLRHWGKFLSGTNCQLIASGMAGATNSAAVHLLQELGVSRVILPRLQSLAELTQISQSVSGIELEVFMNGSLCPLYEGRGCFLKSIFPHYVRGVCFISPEEWQSIKIQGETWWGLGEIAILNEKPTKPLPPCALPLTFKEKDNPAVVRPLWETLWQSNLKYLAAIIDLGIAAVKVSPWALTSESYQTQTALWRRLLDAAARDEDFTPTLADLAENSAGLPVNQELLLTLERD